jgi:cytochrome P450
MALVTELDLPVLDYTDPELRGERFHRTLTDLRADHWLASGPLGYVVLEREAAAHFLRTKSATFPGMKIAELFDITEGPLYEEIRRNILHINGDDHRRLRNLVNPAFTPRAADRWRPAMRDFIARLHEPVAAAGACEFVDAFAKPYPSLTIATVMGAPLEDAPRLHEWSNWIQRQFDAPSLVADRERIERAVTEFYDWAGELLAERRTSPGDDLISTLIAAEADGDRLSDVECVNLVLNVLVGGVDTTQSQLAQAMRLFAAHPDQWAMVAEDPGLAPRAVEEVLRYEPITPFTARIVEQEIEYRGVTFPPDTVVMVCAFTANRDIEGDAQSFDITAERDREKPLTFGAGIHYCLGANLARAELQEALAFLAPRMPGLRLDGEAELGTIQGIYGVDRLPIAWDA